MSTRVTLGAEPFLGGNRSVLVSAGGQNSCVNNAAAGGVCVDKATRRGLLRVVGCRVGGVGRNQKSQCSVNLLMILMIIANNNSISENTNDIVRKFNINALALRQCPVSACIQSILAK